ncbi:pyridoxal phosphate-dependent aminotransferase [Salibacterium salarium]|uniref:cysteine-S-conjugate beta-lyase n=1 Tax=Salibacterium salarium TaxID=284579 RepID=A0A428N0K9_9BACI|nr:MalY/PatB family protein [Salibacterium salarium]RSL31961.1 pyridoxal phosphate-dependent aminotransferase [Salibacterium salarium]
MDFEKVIDRNETNSMKWDFYPDRYGADDLWPMWVADMDFQTPKSVRDAMQEVVDHGIFGYHRRPTSLFDATTAWLKNRFDWEVNNSQIVFTPGVVPAISHLIQTFTEEGDGVIIQPPVYYPFYALVHNNKRTLVRNPLKETEQGFTVDLDDLEKKMQDGAKMLLLCSPHNPIGRVWSEEELTEIAKLAETYKVLVVSDEIHADLILEGKHTPFAKAAAGREVETMTCLAPSKTFNLASLQLSYVVFENDRSQKAYETHLQREFVGIDNPFATAAAEAAYRHGEEWLEHLLEYVRHNVQYVKEYIETNMPEMKVIEPEGTYLIWIDMRELNKNDKELEAWLRKEAKLALSEGHIFGEEGSGFVRINAACPRTTLEEGLKRMNTAYKNL